jgi:fructokinase
MQLLAIGEILWDVIDDCEILGGAPLNFSAAAQRLGGSALLLTGVGNDPRGIRAIDSMKALGLSTGLVQILPGKDTGTALVTADGTGNARFLIRRPVAFDEFELDQGAMSAIEAFDPQWIYFGTLAQTNQPTEDILRRLLSRLPKARCFYDINLRDGHWNLPLVQRLSSCASIVKLNESEAEVLSQLTQPSAVFSLEQFCRHWTSTYGVTTICVTLGSEGCAVFTEGTLQRFEGFKVKVVDTVGSGDAFAAGFLHGYDLKWTTVWTATLANALGALVASRVGATPAWTSAECWHLIAENRSIEAQSVADLRGPDCLS